MPANGATRDLRPAALRAPAWVGVALLLVAIFALYARALGRGFTSEDFLLVRYFGEHPPWRDLRAQLVEPWLGMRGGIEFFRPISTLLYGLEIAAFGTDPRGYLIVHLLTHWLAALLVFAVTRELMRRDPQMPGAAAAPWVAALLFAVYPLHPNAVVFNASFATLFGGLFALLSLYAYQRFRATAVRSWWLAAFVAFVLALGSYEATAVLPIWLVAYDQLAGDRPPSRWRRLLATLPFFALLASYFGWRHHLFGDFVGGYAATREQLGDASTLVADLMRSLGRLHLPFFSQPPSVTIAAVVLLATLAAVAFSRRPGAPRPAAGAWAFGWVMAISAMAPFAFRPVVPANGRYWYLAAAGAAIGVVFIAAGLSARCGSRRWLQVLPWSLAAVVGVAWTSGLVPNVAAHRRAADVVESVRSALLDARPADKADGLPLFVTGHPDFLTEPPGINVAQELRYGLRDSVNPPFVDASAAVDVYPLPPLADGELVPIALAAPGRVLVWDAAASQLRVPSISPSTAALPNLAISGDAVALRVPRVPHQRFRLLLATPINGMVVEADATSVTNGVLRVPLPVDLLAISEHLYGSRDVFLWVEARDERGELAGFTRLHRLAAAAPGQARSLSPIM